MTEDPQFAYSVARERGEAAFHRKEPHDANPYPITSLQRAHWFVGYDRARAATVRQPTAYPVLERGGNGLEMTSVGATLRDRFAEVALASGEAGQWRDNDYQPIDGLSVIQNTARHAYLIADAMLEARGSRV